MKTRSILIVACLYACITTHAEAVVWYDGSRAVTFQVEGYTAPVVDIALDMFANDMLMVTGQRAVRSKDATIHIVELDTNKDAAAKLRKMGVPVDSLSGRHDAFYIAPHPSSPHLPTSSSPHLPTSSSPHLLIVGSNGRGCAYGILELSRKAGVSPWVWWGDVVPERRELLVFDETETTLQAPSVEYRGIFINDEDWSLRNWAWKNYEASPTSTPPQLHNSSSPQLPTSPPPHLPTSTTPHLPTFGHIGPKTYKAIFQLLLRLRANAIWPAMHSGTPGFFTIPGNKEMADSCGIIIGTSHCEPLLRNNVAEWDVKERGPYNYITNREQVQQYWIERLRQVKGSEELFTIGMRGIHDGSMEGVKTKEEKLNGLQQVIDDQRELIRKYYNKDVESVPQVFIPYKEVLEIMESGLRVPDDVTLMWCDDNYGYMTRLSDEDQQRRKRGGGVYYHLSYWGRPHDYLWLTTTQPGLIYSELKTAYDHNCRKLWIANVHDPKVAAYDLELFLDMAWNINAILPNETALNPQPSNLKSQTSNLKSQTSTLKPQTSNLKPQTISQHLQRWLSTQFGENAAQKLFPAMKEFYRLCGIRKPEFMGWTQVELSDRKAYPRGRSHVIDTEFSLTEFGNELERYMADYAAVCDTVEEAARLIRPELKNAYFAHIQYPVLAARAMAVKMLEAQKARSKYLGQTDDAMEGREEYMLQASTRAMQAYREIQRLTDYYNDSLAGGKWKGLMSMMPRDLPVFYPPTLPYLPQEIPHSSPQLPTSSSPHLHTSSSPHLPTSSDEDYIARNAYQYESATKGVQTIQMLGHSMNAVAIPKGGELLYEFDTAQQGEALLYTAMIPTQPNDKGDLRYSVYIDNDEPVVISLKEKYRSDFWKQSVLRGQALKQTPVKVGKGHHTLRIKALDDHIIVDQWMLDFKPDRKFYVIPK